MTLADTTMNTYLRHLAGDAAINERALNGGLDFWALVNSSAIYAGSIQCDYANNYWGAIHQHNSTDVYSFTITRGADAVLKKLGEPVRRTVNVAQELLAGEGAINVDVSLNGYRPVCAGITSFCYTASSNDNSTNIPVSLAIIGNTVKIDCTTNHTVGWCSFKQIILDVTYESV